MHIAILNCYNGISGDMCLGALIDAGAPLELINKHLSTINIPDWTLKTEKVTRNGIAATKAIVSYDHSSHHELRTLPVIQKILDSGNIPEKPKRDAKNIFYRLAEAEAEVHDCDIEKIHFHEVGAVDSIIDITGAALGFWLLGISKTYYTPVAVGSGTVDTMHGTLPVPAPATAKLLEGFRIHTGKVEAELTTPTGAAILSYYTEADKTAPDIRIEKTGFGAGNGDFKNVSNTLRLMIGKTYQEEMQSSNLTPCRDSVFVIETNLDDMTGEETGFLLEKAFQTGALDAFITPIQMKKNRPAFKFTVIASKESKNILTDFLLEHSSTLGVRFYQCQRHKLQCEKVDVQTPWGTVAVKVGKWGDKVIKIKPEFDDCKKIARKENIPPADISQTIIECYKKSFDICT